MIRSFGLLYFCVSYFAFNLRSFLRDDELGLHLVSSSLVVQLAMKLQPPA